MKQGKKTANVIDTPPPDDQLLIDLTRSITREDEAINDLNLKKMDKLKDNLFPRAQME